MLLDFSEDNIIGKGDFRTVYRHGPYAVKVLNETITKFSKQIPTNLYTKIKYGINNFNEFETNVFRKRILPYIPGQLYDCFQFIYPTEEQDGKILCISDLILNYDGSLPHSLSDSGKITDQTFWSRINDLENFFLEKDIPFFGIMDNNILVKETGESFVPVIVDYKRFGREVYPFQLNLCLKSERERKIKRKFSKIRTHQL